MVDHAAWSGTDAAFSADLWRTLIECVRDTDDGWIDRLAGSPHGPARYRENHHGTAPIAHTWPLSQLLHAAALRDDLAVVTEAVAQLEAYRHAGHGFGSALADHPNRSDVYVDDNAWVGLALAQAAIDDPARSPRAGRLGTAARTRLAACARFCLATQRGDGAVPWRVDIADPTHNACSTAPTGVLALRAGALAVLDRDAALDAARRTERFCTQVLGRDDGLIADHQRVDGTIDATVWSYNQGSVVMLRTLLAEIDDDPELLDAALDLADAALAELDGDGIWRQPPAFNGVFFRGLLVLDAYRPYPPARAALRAYLDRVRDEAYDISTGLCLAGDIGAYEQATILDQSALVQCFALADRPRARCGTLC